MSLDSEDAVKKKLGVGSLKNLPKDKLLSFAAAMPEMTSDVRMKLIEQLPAFQKFAGDAVSAVENTLHKVVDSKDSGEAKVHEAFSDVRAALRDDLKRDDISEEHRSVIYDKLMDAAKASSDKDTEGKKFLAEQASETRGSVLKVAGITVIAAIILAGGKILIEQSGGLGSGDEVSEA